MVDKFTYVSVVQTNYVTHTVSILFLYLVEGVEGWLDMLFVKVSLKPNPNCCHPNVRSFNFFQNWGEEKCAKFCVLTGKKIQYIYCHFVICHIRKLKKVKHVGVYLSLHPCRNGCVYTSAFWLFSSTFSSNFFSSSEDPFSFSPVFQLPCLKEFKCCYIM